MCQTKKVNQYFFLVLEHISRGHFHFPRSFSDRSGAGFLKAEHTVSYKVRKKKNDPPGVILRSRLGEHSADKAKLAQGSESWCRSENMHFRRPPNRPPQTPVMFTLKVRKSTFINT